MAKFSDLLLLWPFANELDQTVFVYNQPRAVMYARTQRNVPPNDGIAMLTLSTALGRLAMDDSIPNCYLIGHMDASYERERSSKHLIYIGGRIYNERVEAFLNECSSDLMVSLPSQKPFFSIELTTQDESRLNEGVLPDPLEKEFRARGIQFCEGGQLSIEEEDRAWLIEGKEVTYFLRKDRGIVEVSRFEHMQHRCMETRESKSRSHFEPAFRTDYYGSPENGKVKTDYGLILLADNPFAVAKERKVLLVAGLHSYGTLAAARFASSPSLSAEIARRVMANFHAPLHLCKIVEVIVRAEVDEVTGKLSDPDEKEVGKYIERIFINGDLIYKPDRRPRVDEAHIGPAASRIDVQRIRGTLLLDFTPKHFHSSSVALPMTEVSASLLSDQFFEYFSGRHVIVCSPHSDDSVIACGGLIYYLRNEELWSAYGYVAEQTPSVDVMVMTESSRGVPDQYFEDYCKYIGTPVEIMNERKGEAKAEVRHNESLSEGMLLSTSSHWLNIDILGDKQEIRRKITDKLSEILGDPSPVNPIFLIPNLKEQHPTHRSVTDIMLGILRKVFSIGLGKYQNELMDGIVSDDLRERFRDNGIRISRNTTVSVREEGGVWIIVDQQDSREKYFVKLERGQLDIYSGILPGEVTEIWLYESPWSYLDTGDINVIIPLDKHAMFAKCQAISMHQSQDIRTRYSDIARAHSRGNAETLQEMVYGFASSSRKWNYLEVFSARMWKLLDYSTTDEV